MALLLCAWLFSSAVWAYDFEADGIYYNITSSDEKTVEVTNGGDYSGDVTIPATVTNEESEYRVTAIGDWAFTDCYGLTSVTIPNSVTTIGHYAFSSSGLTSVTIPESVTTIGNGAFSGCSGLTEFKGKFASSDNRCLVVNDTLIAFAPSGLTQYIIPDGVKVIGRAFAYCENLTSITIPESVQTIGDEAFYGCWSLTNFDGKIVTADHRCLVINDTLIAFARSGLTQYTIPDGVKVIGSYAFYNCTGLKSVKIPESAIAIGNDAFSLCDGLTSVTIPNSVTTIGHYAFYNCSGLTEITIPNSVTTIGNSAFFRCEGLNSVTIGEGVQTIGDFAFQRCENLTSVTIGKNVTTIGTAAFLMCYGLTSVTAYNPIPVDIAFGGVDCTKCTLYVPAESVELYKAAEGWKEFGKILPIDESSAITETQQDKADGHVTVYNLQGVPVLETDDAADLKTLQNGAYIVNGKKMIIAR